MAQRPIELLIRDIKFYTQELMGHKSDLHANYGNDDVYEEIMADINRCEENIWFAEKQIIEMVKGAQS